MKDKFAVYEWNKGRFLAAFPEIAEAKNFWNGVINKVYPSLKIFGIPKGVKVDPYRSFADAEDAEDAGLIGIPQNLLELLGFKESKF